MAEYFSELEGTLSLRNELFSLCRYIPNFSPTIFEAAVDVARSGVKVYPEVMIPMAATRKEVANQSAIIRRVAK